MGNSSSNSLKGGAVEITAAYPAGMIGITKENLAAAAAANRWSGARSTRHLQLPRRKRDSRISPISSRWSRKWRSTTRPRYGKLHANLVNGTVFKSEMPSKWYCRNCGFVHDGKIAPAKCPVAITRRRTPSWWQKTI